MVTVFFGQSAGTYEHYFSTFVSPVDVVYSGLKVVVLTTVVTLIHCYHGFTRQWRPRRRRPRHRPRHPVQHHHADRARHPAHARALGSRPASADLGLTGVSEFLFPSAGRDGRAVRARMLAIAAVATAAMVVVTGYLGASYLGIVTDDVSADAELATTGDSLGVGSDVKFRGLRVGRVLKVQSGELPSAEIVLMHDHAGEIPADVTARVLPGTLFGNEYVELVSAGSGTGAIADGASIPADRSAETLRLMDTFAATQRLLGAVDPARLDAAISQLATALDGRGDDLARFVVDADDFLATWAQHEPAFYRDLDLLARNVDTLADVEPQLVAALRDSLPLARTIAEKEQQTQALMTSGARLVGSVDDFLGTQADRIVQVLDGTAATLDVFASRHTAFETLLAKLPPVLRNGATAIKDGKIQMNGALALTFPDPYDEDDCPRYGSLEGKNCPGSGQ